jgi:hypothetical protein
MSMMIWTYGGYAQVKGVGHYRCVFDNQGVILLWLPGNGDTWHTVTTEDTLIAAQKAAQVHASLSEEQRLAFAHLPR